MVRSAPSHLIGRENEFLTVELLLRLPRRQIYLITFDGPPTGPRIRVY